jgi:hypothetical protein
VFELIGTKKAESFGNACLVGSKLGAILPRDCPPKLYKYFAPERYSFFADLRIRYSQLGAFNDPFEGRPEVTSLFVGTLDILRQYNFLRTFGAG